MQEIKQDQIPEIIQNFPSVEDVINEVRKNSTYGKFCMAYIIINELQSLNNTDYKLFTFIFRMPITVVLKSHNSQSYIAEWSKRYYYYELQHVIEYISQDLDTEMLRNVSNILSRYTDINLVTFKVKDTPYKMAWEIGD